MTQSGWRKPTLELGIAEQLAQAGEHSGIPKSRAIIAVKRVAAHIGLKAGDMLLLDTLSAFSKPQDWEVGRRPIVWASNAYLVEQTGLSLSAVKRHARRLGEAGVIAFKDSPNGKRWGRRDQAGFIVEAYGFDLSPLAARAQELEDLREDIQAERDLCRFLKRQITVARRKIRARLEAATEDTWTDLHERYAALLGNLSRRAAASDPLRRTLAALEQLGADVEGRYLAQFEDVEPTSEAREKIEKMNPKRSDNEPHIHSTKEHKEVINVQDYEETCLPTNLKTVLQACPEFTAWTKDLGRHPKNWRDAYLAAGELSPMLGVPKEIWGRTQRQLGQNTATAAFILVFDKFSNGEVRYPCGYLQGMVAKAKDGTLNLDRSLHGRLHRQAA